MTLCIERVWQAGMGSNLRVAVRVAPYNPMSACHIRLQIQFELIQTATPAWLFALY